MTHHRHSDCEWVRERIEAWLDGELDRPGADRFERHVGECPDCDAQIELGRSVLATLRSLPAVACPGGLVERAAAVAEGSRTRPTLRERLAGWFEPHREVLLRPAMVAMILVVIAAGVFVLTGRNGMNGDTDPYSRAEVEAAAQDAMIAFAYVGRYTRRTGSVLRREVVAERIAPRIERALSESRRHVVDDVLVPAVERAVLDALFVETIPRINPLKERRKEGRPK